MSAIAPAIAFPGRKLSVSGENRNLAHCTDCSARAHLAPAVSLMRVFGAHSPVCPRRSVPVWGDHAPINAAAR